MSEPTRAEIEHALEYDDVDVLKEVACAYLASLDASAPPAAWQAQIGYELDLIDASRSKASIEELQSDNVKLEAICETYAARVKELEAKLELPKYGDQWRIDVVAPLEARIKELEYERDRWKHVRENAPDYEKLWAEKAEQLDAAEAHIKELKGALKPFADYADTVEKFVSDRAADGGSPIMPTNNFRLSHFRAARRALAAAEKPNA